jgi:hypothetical protein
MLEVPLALEFLNWLFEGSVMAYIRWLPSLARSNMLDQHGSLGGRVWPASMSSAIVVWCAPYVMSHGIVWYNIVERLYVEYMALFYSRHSMPSSIRNSPLFKWRWFVMQKRHTRTIVWCQLYSDTFLHFFSPWWHHRAWDLRVETFAPGYSIRDDNIYFSNSLEESEGPPMVFMPASHNMWIGGCQGGNPSWFICVHQGDATTTLWGWYYI